MQDDTGMEQTIQQNSHAQLLIRKCNSCRLMRDTSCFATSPVARKTCIECLAQKRKREVMSKARKALKKDEIPVMLARVIELFRCNGALRSELVAHDVTRMSTAVQETILAAAEEVITECPQEPSECEPMTGEADSDDEALEAKAKRHCDAAEQILVAASEHMNEPARVKQERTAEEERTRARLPLLQAPGDEGRGSNRESEDGEGTQVRQDQELLTPESIAERALYQLTRQEPASNADDATENTVLSGQADHDDVPSGPPRKCSSCQHASTRRSGRGCLTGLRRIRSHHGKLRLGDRWTLQKFTMPRCWQHTYNARSK
jgi:hypothetical protein